MRDEPRLPGRERTTTTRRPERIDPRRRAALGALLAAAAALGGCATGRSTDPTDPAETSQPAAPIKTLTVLYAQSELPPGRSAASAAALARVGYHHLPGLVLERIGPVLAANGLQAGRLLAIDASTLVSAVQHEAQAAPDTPILTIHIIGGGTLRPAASGRPADLYFRQQADLYRPSPFSRIWSGQFENALVHSSPAAIRYDRANVDRMLTDLVRQLVHDRIVAEPPGGIRLPEQPPER